MRHLKSEFAKFCIVGVICTIIDASVFYETHETIGYRMAMVLGFVVSISVNYLLNIFWSFRVKPSVKNALGTISAHCFNIFVVRMCLMWLFVDCILLPDSVAYIPTLMISTITNFLVIHYVVHKLS